MQYLSWNIQEHLEVIKVLLKEDKLLVGTSDTVIGLLSCVNEHTYNRLNTIKKRMDKPYLILVDSLDTVRGIVDEAAFHSLLPFMKACWPGPVTMVCRAAPSTPHYMQTDKGTIGIRMASHAGLQNVLHDCGMLFSTSANTAGTPIPVNTDSIDADLLSQVAAIITDGESAHQSSPLSSTIIDVTGSQLVIVRQGAYPIDDLKKLWRGLVS